MKNVIFILVVLASGTTYAQQDTHEVTIREQYQATSELGDKDVENADPELLIKHTYPPLVELMGGKDQYIQLVRQASAMEEDMDEEEFEDEEEGPWTLQESRVELGEVGQIHQIGDELQAVIEVKEVDVYSDREEILRRYQLAISRDGGDFWYFLDGTMDWSSVVPNLHSAITQPEEEQETVFK